MMRDLGKIHPIKFNLLYSFLFIAALVNLWPGYGQVDQYDVVAKKLDFQQETTHPDMDLSPRISPDGKWMAYVSRQTLNYDIWVSSTRGGRPFQITFNDVAEKADDLYPTWTHDSKGIVFVSQRSDAAGDIWMIRLKESGGRLLPRGKPRQISFYQGFDGYPTVSPDGKKIAWVSDRTGRHEIWFYNENTGKTTQLTFKGGTHPAWSSNQELIAFTSFREQDSNGDIFIINLHGPKPQTEHANALWDERELPIYQVTKGLYADGFPTWSPGAQSICFLRYAFDTNRDSLLTPADKGILWSVDVNPDPYVGGYHEYPLSTIIAGSFNLDIIRYATPFTSGGENVMQPWFGGDNRIYFTSDRGGNLDIWSMPQGGHIARLENAVLQFELADEAYPLPRRMTRQILGPLYLGKNDLNPSYKERELLWDRSLAHLRVIDFHGDDSVYVARSLYGIGVCYLLLGYNESAEDHLNSLLNNYSNIKEIAAYGEMAQLGFRVGSQIQSEEQMETAVNGLDDIIVRYRSVPEPAAAAQLSKGDIYFSMKKGTEAFTEYSKVIKNYPQERNACAEAQLKMGDIFRQFANKKEVIRTYLAVVQDYPEQRQWMLPARDRILDLLTENVTDSNQLISRYREIVGQYEEFSLLAAAAQLRIGKLLYDRGDYRACIKEYEMVTLRFPEHVDEVFMAQVAVADANYRMGETLKAFNSYETLIEQYRAVRPDLSERAKSALIESLLKTADQLNAGKDYELALVHYRKVFRIDLQNVHAHRGYIECMYYLKRIDEAVREYESLKAANSENNILIYSLGLAYSYKGTERAELYGDPDGLDPDYLIHKSSYNIAQALAFDYTFVQPYLTLSYNYEMMEKYEERQKAKPVPFLRKVYNTLSTPIKTLINTLTFQHEGKPKRYYERAVYELTKARVLNDESKEPALEAALALNLANNYYNLSEFGFEKAYENYHVKLKYDSSFTDIQQEALIYERMGHCAMVTEDMQHGPQYLRHAIELYRKMGREASVLLNTKRLALLHEIGNQNDQAIEYYQQAADIEKRFGVYTDLMRSYRSIAYNYLLLGEPEDAIVFANNALELLEGGKVKEIKAEKNRLKVGFLGLYVAVPVFDLSSFGFSSRTVFTAEDERALLYTILGESYKQVKDFSKAIPYFENKMEIFKKRKDDKSVATFLNNIGYLYFLKGDYASAWRYFSSSLTLCEETKYKFGIVNNSLNLSLIASGLNLERSYGTGQKSEIDLLEGYTKTAVQKINIALRWIEEDSTLFSRQRGQLLLQLAELVLINTETMSEDNLERELRFSLNRLEKADDARTFLLRAIVVARRFRLVNEECAATFALGKVYQSIRNITRASRYLRRARRIALQNGLYEILWRIDVSLGDLISSMDYQTKLQFTVQEDPLEFYLEAIEVLESHMSKSNGATASALRRAREQPYRRAIAYLVSKGDVEGGLEFTERMRAKSYLDLVYGKEIILRKELHKIYYSNAKYLQDRVNELDVELLRGKSRGEMTTAQKRELRKQREAYQEEYQVLLEKIRGEVPELENLVRVNPIKANKIQKQLRSTELLISYLILENKTLVWILSATDISTVQLDISKAQLEKDLNYFMQHIRTGSVEQDSIQTLIKILTPFRDENNIFIIVPDHPILLLPWRPLIGYAKRFEGTGPMITVSSSLTSYAYAMQKRKIIGNRIYVANNRNLRNTLNGQNYEVITPLEGQKVNSFNAQGARFGMADYIHLDVENRWNKIDPMMSRVGFVIHLSAPAVFTPMQLFQKSFSASLLTLHPDQPFSFSSDQENLIVWEKSLLYAGIPTLLVPLWAGDQESDLLFYNTFYSNMRTMPPMMALAETERILKQQGSQAWSRFQVYGFGGMTAEEEEKYASEDFENIVRYGHYAFNQSDWIDAINFYQEAQQMAQRQGDEESVQRLRQRILESAVNGEQWEKAIIVQSEMITIAKETSDLSTIANGYNNLAFFYLQNQQFEQSVLFKTRYAELADKYGLQEEEANSLRETGLIYERGGNYTMTLEFINRAYDRFAKMESKSGQARCLRDMGRIHFLYLDDYAQALDYQERALALFEQMPISADFVDVVQNIGLTHEKIANYKQALIFQEKALSLSQELADEKLQGLSYQYIANVSWKMGDYQTALSNQNKAMNYFQKLDEQKLLQVAYSTRGLIALSFGQAIEALDFQNKALELAVERADLMDQATIFKNIGIIYRTEGQYDLALSNFEQAMAIDSSLQSQRGLAYDYRNMANVYIDLGRYETAQELARLALSISRSIKDLRNEAQSLLVLGSIMMNKAPVDSSVKYLHWAEELAEEAFMPEILWRAQKQLAEIWLSDKKTDLAIEELYEALETIENMRARIKVEEYASGFIDDKLDVYGMLIGVLYEHEKYVEALQVVERSKSRSFLDLLGNRDLNYRTVADSSLMALGDSLHAELNRLESELLFLRINEKEESNTRDKIEARIAELRTEYSDFLLGLNETNPMLSEMVHVDPIAIEGVQKVLPDSTALIEYYFFRDQLYAWLVINHSIAAHRQTIEENMLENNIVNLRKALDNELSFSEDAGRLYEMLIKPFQTTLKDIRHIIFIPFKQLHYLPFAILQDNEGHYLGLDYSTSLAPSASVLIHCMKMDEDFMIRDKKNLSVLAFGNPDLGDPAMDLPFAGREIRSIGRYYNDLQLYLNDRATETRFRDQASYPPIMVFSCHGVFDAVNPLLSALLLSPDGTNDGRLEVHEIFGFNLDAYIIAMSACETGLGTVRGGDEVIGLARSFIYAGSPSLLSSLWKVDDLATAVLIKRFFRYLAEGMSRAEALRQAQKIVFHEINSYPAYWAAFTITGDFR